MELRLPIIICESQDVDVFETVESAELKLEPIDVLNGEYVGYDAEGRLLSLEVREEERSILFGLTKGPVEVTRIFCHEQEPLHQKELYEFLVSFFKWIDKPLSSKETLEELVKKVINECGYTT
jgi:hypothetical protein